MKRKHYYFRSYCDPGCNCSPLSVLPWSSVQAALVDNADCKVTGGGVNGYYSVTCTQCSSLVFFSSYKVILGSPPESNYLNIETQRFCKTEIRTKFRDGPCKNVHEFSHELCVLHIFVACTRQVHVRHDPISRNFPRKFISRSRQVSRPKL